MDQSRFDRLSQSLADPRLRARRGILAALGAALVGAIVGADFDDADASRKRQRHPNHTKRHHSRQQVKKHAKQRKSDARERQRAATQKKRGKKRQGQGSCGGCAANETCQGGSCVCLPNCDGKACGNDGCGGACGDCAGSETCDHGTCRCQPQCDGKTCGPDGCGGMCGSCGTNELCDGGSCLCRPDCGTKVCGGVGCGGSCGSCTDQGAATCGTTGACRGGDCERYASGTECQAAVCTSKTTLQPACTCDGQGGCDCPGPITCPKNLGCHNGACLTSCRTNDDCANDNVCNAAIGQCGPLFTCDCSNFNACNGHGLCTEACTCRCDEGWSGIACDIPTISLRQLGCSDYTTCGECNAHAIDSCTWCSLTLDGSGGSGVCTISENCATEEYVCA
jgi:hypothetical protein